MGRRSTSTRCLALTGVALAGSALACSSGPDSGSELAQSTAALIPAPGETRIVGLETDALGNALFRGTRLDEQYADWGIHFNDVFYIGERTVDFPDFTRPPLTGNMLCTWVAWADTGRCFEPVGTADAKLVVNLDFPACKVEVEGRTRGDGEADRDLLDMKVFDQNDLKIGSTLVPIDNFPAPYQPEGVVNAVVEASGIRRIEIEDGWLDALDTLKVTRCDDPCAGNPPPVAKCAPRSVCNLPGQCVGTADIDDGSFDPDGEPLTKSYAPASPYPIGTTDVTLTVADGCGRDQCTATVTVKDCEPPVVTPKPPISLWPPNHQYRTITLADCIDDVTDLCSPVGGDGCKEITCVTSDEADDGPPTDIVLVDSTTVQLLAERDPHGDGRVYTINYEVKDAAGNTVTKQCTATVPHDQGHPPVDSGVVEQVCRARTCP